MREEMRGVLMREEAEEEIQVLFKNLKSTSTYFSVGVDYSKPSLIGATYPTKFITDGKGTIGIGRRAHFLDLLSTIEPRYMSYMREAFAPIFLVTYADKNYTKAMATFCLYSWRNYERQYFQPICYIRSTTSSSRKINHMYWS